MKFLNELDNKSNYAISFKAINGKQFGKPVITAQAKVSDITLVFEVDRSVQRELNSNQVASISNYIINRLQNSESPVFFPPFVFSDRGHGMFIQQDAKYKLKVDNRIAVLDGQHRLEALKGLETRLKDSEDPEEQALYQKLIDTPLTLQIYEGLNIEQEQQLFTDINAMNTRVGANLIKYYDEHNPTSILMRDVVNNHPSIAFEQFEVRKNTTRRKLMTGLLVYRLIATLHSGKVISNQVEYTFPKSEKEDLRNKVILFLNLLVKYMPTDAFNRNDSIYLNQSIILAIGKIAYSIKDTSQWEALFKEVIFTYNWSHTNKDLLRARVPYNQETNRFRLTPESKVINTIKSALIRKKKEVL